METNKQKPTVHADLRRKESEDVRGCPPPLKALAATKPVTYGQGGSST